MRDLQRTRRRIPSNRDLTLWKARFERPQRVGQRPPAARSVETASSVEVRSEAAGG